MSPLRDSAAAIDRFIDALWIEDGLSKNTLEAYRRDLTLYAHWLAAAPDAGPKLDAEMKACLAMKAQVVPAKPAD